MLFATSELKLFHQDTSWEERILQREHLNKRLYPSTVASKAISFMRSKLCCYSDEFMCK